MNKGIALAAAAVLALGALTGCSGSAVEEPVAPSSDATSTGTGASLALTDDDKLKAMAVGETAVWNSYALTIDSISRESGLLNVNVTFENRGIAKTLQADCLLSFGMPPVSSTFSNGEIALPASGTVSGTITFDDPYTSQRLLWNDGATEATWLLDLEPVTTQGNAQEAETTESEPAAKEENSTDDAQAQAQAQAITTLEAEIPTLFLNNTYYQYLGVDSAAATVTPIEGGGYEYVNTANIIDGAGNPTTANIRLLCEPNGNCYSMEIDGTLLF